VSVGFGVLVGALGLAGRRTGEGRIVHLSADHVELELSRVVDAPGITHLHYRVRQTQDAADRHLA
jgi:hypothetical protein